jgi:hypothetical protein
MDNKQTPDATPSTSSAPSVPKGKLSIAESTLLQLVYLKTPSNYIPDQCWSDENIDELGKLQLITESHDANGDILLDITDKGRRVVENGEYIIKYPLADDSGTATSYNDTLMSMTSNAKQALAAAMIATGFARGIGFKMVHRLHDHLMDSVEYYITNRDNPMSAIYALEQMERIAYSKKDTFINMVFDTIEPFVLSNPIKYYVPSGIDPDTTDVTERAKIVYLIQVTSPNEILCSSSSVIDRRTTAITPSIKIDILKQYFDGLSRFNNPALKVHRNSNINSANTQDTPITESEVEED